MSAKMDQALATARAIVDRFMRGEISMAYPLGIPRVKVDPAWIGVQGYVRGEDLGLPDGYGMADLRLALLGRAEEMLIALRDARWFVVNNVLMEFTWQTSLPVMTLDGKLVTPPQDRDLFLRVRIPELIWIEHDLAKSPEPYDYRHARYDN